MRITKKSLVLVLSLVSSLFLIWMLAGCTTKTAKTIKIGQAIDLTGPIAASGKILVDDGQWTTKYINDFKGLDGAGTKLDWLWADDAFSPPRTISAFQRMKEQGIVLFIVQNSTSVAALAPIAERAQVPIIGMNAEPDSLYPPGWVYLAFPTANADLFVGALTWIKQDFKETTRPPKVAIMGWDNALGRSTLMAKKYWEDLKIEIVTQDFLPVFATDWSTPLIKARDAKADYIFVSNSHPASEFVLRDAERTGIRGKIPIIMNGISVQMDTSIEAAGSLSEGVYWIMPWNMSPDLPGIKELSEAKQKVLGKETVLRTETIHEWGPLIIGSEAIKRAIKNVGVEKVTGAEVKKALDSFKDFDTGGITPPITYGPDNRRGGRAVWAYQVKSGKRTLISKQIPVPFVKP